MARPPGLISHFADELVLASALLAALLLFAAGPRIGGGVIGRTVAATFNPPRAFVAWMEEGRVLREEHDALVAETARLKMAVLRDRELAMENQRLRHLLDFCEGSAAPMISARVVGLQGSAWSGDLRMILDKGERSGISVGMAVMTPQGLVGRVAIANDYSATVEPLYSRSLAVSAYDQRTRVVGIVRWSSGVHLGFEKVPLHCDVAPGDTLVTSGLGGGYPRGVGIGVISALEARDYDLFLRVEVNPFVDFQQIEEVLVVLDEAPGASNEARFDEADQTLTFAADEHP
jgi:rod shape-determining protein MreC